MTHLKFSIVTPSYNQGQFIEETIQSVLTQTGNFSIDYVVYDALSTDQSWEVIQRRQLEAQTQPGKYPGVSFRAIREKDGGQASAINKGLRQAKGDILAFLNSDDLYEEGAFQRVAKAFEDESIDVVYGNGFYIDENSRACGLYSTEDINEVDIFAHCFICQPTLFFRRRVWESLGEFNEKIHNSIDYEYWIRMKLAGFRFKCLRTVLASSRIHSATKTVLNRRQIHLENFAIAEHFGRVPAIAQRRAFFADVALLPKIFRKGQGALNRIYGKLITHGTGLYFKMNKNAVRAKTQQLYPHAAQGEGIPQRDLSREETSFS